MTTKFLHLPDDVLLRIFLLLHGPTPLYARQARHANALSLTCTRLRSIYARTLHILDARSYGDSLWFAPLPRSLNVGRICAFVRMAGEALQICKLPTLQGDDIGHVLESVAEWCMNVTQLAFTDKGGVNEDIAKKVFEQCAKIERVLVLAPARGVLQHLGRCRNLKHVQLCGVPYNQPGMLVEYLKGAGRGLTKVHVGLTESKLKRQMVQGGDVAQGQDVLNSLLGFLGEGFCDEMSKVRELRVDISPENVVRYSRGYGSNRQLYQTIRDVGRKVLEAFEDDMNNNGQNGCLKELWITVEHEYVFRALDALGGILKGLECLWVQIPGALIKFVRMGDEVKTVLQGVKMYQDVGVVGCAVGEGKFVELETLDLGEVCVTPRNGWRDSRQVGKMLQNVVEQAGENLTTVIAGELVKLKRNVGYEEYVSKVLQWAPSVERLEMSFEIVFAASDGAEWVQRLVSAMGGVKEVMLKSRYACDGMERAWMPMGAKFVKGVPPFLGLLQKYCPRLQRVGLETLRAWGGEKVDWADMRDALTAVAEFEFLLQGVDAGGIRAQLYCLQKAAVGGMT